MLALLICESSVERRVKIALQGNLVVPLQEDLYVSIREVGILQNLQCPGLVCMREENDYWRDLIHGTFDYSSGCMYKRVPFCPPGQSANSNGHSCLPSIGGSSIL